MAKNAVEQSKKYVVGIDVGTHSVGLAAIELGEDGMPKSILSAISQLHDSGVLNAKFAESRLAVAGVSRRARRLLRRRSSRLTALDAKLNSWGWIPLDEENLGKKDPYLPWRARKRLATELIEDIDERHSYLATALRHMARHRGWRNPYQSTLSLQQINEPSEFLKGVGGVKGFKERVEESLGIIFDDSVTVAELAVAAIDGARATPLRPGKTAKLRDPKQNSLIAGKLHQSDNANELFAYASQQNINSDELREIIELVFQAESPRGSWISKIGSDPLDSTQKRASRATDAFQTHRIAQQLANVRVTDVDTIRVLTVAERQDAFEYLLNSPVDDAPTWGDVATALGLKRRALSGTAEVGQEGDERLPARPQVHATDQSIRDKKNRKKLPQFQSYWMEAESEERDALIELLVDGKPKSSPGQPSWEDLSEANNSAWELLNNLDEDELMALESLNLQAGRSSYSVKTLRRLTQRMMCEEVDLHEARKLEFGVGDDWVPPSDPIGAPVGNPAVDRVTKIVARWLLAAESEWGKPERITIEHVRASFLSERAIREIDRENNKRYAAKSDQRRLIGETVKSVSVIRDSDVRRYEAVQRQKGQCLYCGDLITFNTCEMDHIVPRRGIGSTNTRSNLVAVCRDCNSSKSSVPFAVWVKSNVRPNASLDGALDRLSFWLQDTGTSKKTWAKFLGEISDRLERTEEDPEIDGRSLESVAWMANELRSRIVSHLGLEGTKVVVYKGAITAEARKSSGLEGKIPWVGGSNSKTRLDRRHHAVDACVSALLDDSVANTLAQKINLRTSEYATQSVETWKTWRGPDGRANQKFQAWLLRMDVLSELLSSGFESGQVVVMEKFRLRLANGKVHDDTIQSFEAKGRIVSVGAEMDRDLIDAASTPALWNALTRDAKFDPQTGLPADSSRTIRVNGEIFGPLDKVKFFKPGVAALKVRNGWAEIGDSIHHTRIYRWDDKGKTKYGMLRVFTADLLRHRNENLFEVEPLPSWISMRAAHPSIGRSDLSDKEYLGWLVAGDEIGLEASKFATSKFAEQMIGQFHAALGLTNRWQISGFPTDSRLRLRPVSIAGEGLERYLDFETKDGTIFPDSQTDAMEIILTGQGWRPSIQVLFGTGALEVVRRDALGRSRHKSRAGLPVSWSNK